MDENTTPDVRDEKLAGTFDDGEELDGYEDGDLDMDMEDVDEDQLDDAMSAASVSGEDSADQLRDLVAWIVGQLVDEPENVTVEAMKRGSSVQVQVRLPEEDLGKVIGRGGRIAKSMRTALMIVGSRHHLRVSLDIEGQA